MDVEAMSALHWKNEDFYNQVPSRKMLRESELGSVMPIRLFQEFS